MEMWPRAGGGSAGGGVDPTQRLVFLDGADDLLLHLSLQVLEDGGQGPLQEILIHVHQSDGSTRVGTHMGDAVSHGPAAEYRDSFYSHFPLPGHRVFNPRLSLRGEPAFGSECLNPQEPDAGAALLSLALPALARTFSIEPTWRRIEPRSP